MRPVTVGRTLQGMHRLLFLSVTTCLAASVLSSGPAQAGPPPLCTGQVVTVVLADGDQPTTGADVIWGTTGADVVHALGGDDVICGRGGADHLYGERGDDELSGGPGGDQLVGGIQDDSLYGNGGPDHLVPGSGFDLCDGGPGVDTSDPCEAVPVPERAQAAMTSRP